MAVEVKEEERKGGDKGGEVYVYGTINFHLAEEERLGLGVYIYLSLGFFWTGYILWRVNK